METALSLKPLETHGVSPTCLSHTWNTLLNLFQKSPWALQMLDATSKVPQGVLMGNIMDFGNYDECLQVDVKEDWGSFVGQHCISLLNIPIKANSSISLPSGLKQIALGFSLCIPSTCTPQDLQYGLSKISNELIVEPLLCHSRLKPPMELTEWIAIYVTLMLALICVFSTTYDLLIVDREHRNKWLLLFSFYTNGKSLFSTEKTPGSLDALHGIRFLSIIWIIAGHVAVLASVTPAVNFLNAMELARTWPYTILFSGLLTVDTFFLISGLLLCYVFMKAMESGKRFNLPIFWLHRILRIVPTLGFLVLLHISILHRLGDGPFWDIITLKKGRESCQKYWYSTLFFFQNYYNPSQRCIPTSWFLAVDMQLYIISPILLFGLLKRTKITLYSIFALIIAGTAIIFANTYITRDDPNQIRPNFTKRPSYYQTHTRYGPWLIGLVLGYAIHKTTDWRERVAAGTSRLSKVIIICGWTFAILCIVGTIAGLYPFQQKDHVYNVLEAAFYFSLSRLFWTIGIAIIIFFCVSGYGGIANTILCWRAFRPLSRLTFSIYLIHFEITVSLVFSMKVPAYTSGENQVAEFFSVLVLSTVGAIILSLLIEAPVIGLERILLRGGDKKESQSNLSSTASIESEHTNPKNDILKANLISPPRIHRRV